MDKIKKQKQNWQILTPNQLIEQAKQKSGTQGEKKEAVKNGVKEIKNGGKEVKNGENFLSLML